MTRRAETWAFIAAWVLGGLAADVGWQLASHQWAPFLVHVIAGWIVASWTMADLKANYNR